MNAAAMATVSVGFVETEMRAHSNPLAFRARFRTSCAFAHALAARIAMRPITFYPPWP